MGISTDDGDDGRALRRRLELPFALLSDPGRTVIDAYGVSDADAGIAVPAVFVIRADGTIHWRYLSGTKADRPSPADILQHVRQAIP